MPPVNDAFANAIELVGPAGTITGTIVGATMEAGEPPPGDADYGWTGNTTVWFKWTADRPGVASFDLLGSMTDPAAPNYSAPGNALDTVVHIYTGTAVGALHLVGTSDDWHRPRTGFTDGNSTSHAEFDVIPGTTYHIRVNGYSPDDWGSLVLRWANTVEAVVMAVWELDSLTGSPPPDSGWQGDYPTAAQPFLTGFTQSPQASPCLMYRETATGDLIRVIAYQESPNFVSGGPDSTSPDSAYGPALPQPVDWGRVPIVNPDGTAPDQIGSQVAGAALGTAFCGWFSGSVFCLEIDGTLRWMHDGGGGSSTIHSETTRPAVTRSGVWVLQDGDDPAYPNGSLIKFDLFTGDIIAHVEPFNATHPSIVPGNWDGCLVAPVFWYSSSTLLFTYNGGDGTDHGIYQVDTDTGAVTEVVRVATIALAAGITSWSPSYYLNVGGLALHPDGNQMVFVVQYHDGDGYHSVLVEVNIAAVPSVVWTYRQAYDLGNRLTMMWDVAYSVDGNWLYAVGDTSYPIIQRFARGAGSVGGDAPWMHGDWLTHADWVADGSPTHFSSSGGRAVWGSILAGVQATRAVGPDSSIVPTEPAGPGRPANDDFEAARLMATPSGSFLDQPIDGATLQSPEPPTVGGFTETIWYDWTAPGDGRLSLDSNVALEVFTGPDRAHLTLVADTAPTRRGVMLGWYDGTHAQLVADGNTLGKAFAVERIYTTKDEWGQVKASVHAALASGKLPLVSHKPPDVAGSWAAVAAGTYDTELGAIASAYAALAAEFPTSEIIFVLHHEPHDESTLKVGGTYGTPADFVAAFRYVESFLRSHGASTLRYGYCAVDSWANDYPGDQCYPGDDVVDVLCHDYYNWGSYKPSGWQEPAAKFASLVAIAAATGKPVLPGEVGCHPSEGPHSRDQWFRDLAAWIESDAAARTYFIGFCYYHVNNHGGSGHYWGFINGGPFDGDGRAGWVDAFVNDNHFRPTPVAVTPETPAGSTVDLEVARGQTYHVRLTQRAVSGPPT